MNIAFVVPYVAKTGPINVLVGLLYEICKNHNVIVFTMSGKNDCDVVCEIESAGARVHAMDFGWLERWMYFRSCCDKSNVDVINAHGVVPAVFSLLAVPKRIKFVQTIHHDSYNYFISKVGKFFGSIVAWVEVFVAGKADAAVIVSGSLLTDLNGIRSDAKVVENGVLAERYIFDSLARMRIRNELGIDDSSDVFIYTGHLIEKKGVKTIVEKFVERNEAGEHLILVGDGLLFGYLSDMYSNQRNIHLVGRRSNVNDYLSAGDFYVSASESEGMPMSVLEALSCGCYCLLSDIGPHRKIAEKLGDKYVDIVSWNCFPKLKLQSGNERNVAPSWVGSRRMAEEFVDVLISVVGRDS